jgi:hypothetical protein
VPLDPIIGYRFPGNLLLFKWAFFGTFFAQSKRYGKNKIDLKREERSACPARANLKKLKKPWYKN